MSRLHLLHHNQCMSALTTEEWYTAYYISVAFALLCSSRWLHWNQLFHCFFYCIVYFVLLFCTRVSHNVNHNVSGILKLFGCNGILFYEISYRSGYPNGDRVCYNSWGSDLMAETDAETILVFVQQQVLQYWRHYSTL